MHRYLNGKKVPQLFVLSGATKWADPKNVPWTMPGMATYQSEGVIYAKHVLRTKPDAKIAILPRTMISAATMSPASSAGSATRPPA